MTKEEFKKCLINSGFPEETEQVFRAFERRINGFELKIRELETKVANVSKRG